MGRTNWTDEHASELEKPSETNRMTNKDVSEKKPVPAISKGEVKEGAKWG